MNLQLLILGNGFDLNCGLESGYENFFRSSILDTYSERNGFPKMQQDCDGFWENLLFRYYVKYNKRTNYKWCNIETIIKNTLRTVFYGDITEPSINIKYGLWKTALEEVKANIDPIEQAKGSDDIIRKFLNLYCIEFFYSVNNYRNKRSDQEYFNLLIEHLLNELHNFERRFCKYIKNNIVNSIDEKIINTDYIINAVNLIAKLTGFYKGDFKNIDKFVFSEDRMVEEQISPSHTVIKNKKVKILSKEFLKLKYTHILSFNYTALFDILDVDSPCIYSNVHGKICGEHCGGECTGSTVIFGIDDTFIKSHNEYTELRVFSKTYRKMLNPSTPVSILPPNNGVPVEIKFFGHSLSEADYSYFQSIFDFYNLYSNNNVSLTFYYSNGFEQTDEIYRLINSYGKTLTNQEQGKNLIHKLLLENRLKIVEVK